MTNGAGLVTSEADLSAEAIIKRISAAGERLAEHLVEEEGQRRLSDETVEVLREAGAFRMAVPKRLRGAELKVREQLDVLSAVAEINPSAAWVLTLNTQAGGLVGSFSEQNQIEMFGDNPDASICGALPPSVEARAVPGGWSVNGRHHYATGSPHATWAIVNCFLFNEQGEPIGLGLLYARTSEVTSKDDWFTAGMRATASNTLVWEDVFVPAERLVPFDRLTSGTPPTSYDEPLYRVPVSSHIAALMPAVQLGIGRAVLDLVLKGSQKPIAYTLYTKQAESVGFQLQVARAATLIETATLHAYRAADLLDEWGSAHHWPSALERAKIRVHASTAIESITEALDALLYAKGAGSFAESSPLQRYWRDSSTVARHAYSLPQVNAEIYGKALLGIDEVVSPLA